MFLFIVRRLNLVDMVLIKYFYFFFNKIKYFVNVVRWMLEGRRFLMVFSSGEFMFWNGIGFNFEIIMQVYDFVICVLVYFYSDDWFVFVDYDGMIKYW